MFRACTIQVVVILMLAGCAVGPNYKRPAVDPPENYRFATTQASASFADLPWWQVFNDPTLEDLIRTALKNNYDVRIAASRVEQARQLAAQAASQFYPAVGYQAGVGRGENTFFGGAQSNLSGTANAAQLALGAAWELDVWGRIRRLNESAQAQFLATEQARRGVMLSLVSDVAQAYFELLALDLELKIARDSTESFEESLKVFSARLQGGVGNNLATARAAGALGAVASQIPELLRQIAIKENQINVLLGRNPAPVPRNTTLLAQSMPPEIPAGLPSALLERRPDILAAEDLVRSANAQIGVSIANFFPKIGLTALYGRVSPDLDAVSLGSAKTWGIAAVATGPLFEGGKLIAQNKEARAAWEQSVLQYQQTILKAFEEVSNALVSRERYADTRLQWAQSVDAYRNAVTVANERFNAGTATYYEVLEAQQQLYPAETALAQTDLSRYLVIVQLYKALGGGWQLTDEQFMAQSVPATTQPATTQTASATQPSTRN